MHNRMRALGLLSVLVLIGPAASSRPFRQLQKEMSSTEPTSVVITFKDGHQQTYAMADIERIEYKDVADSTLGLDHFFGTWEVGDGNSGTFLITFEANGEANRSLGASHGIWVVTGDEARITWDDGWHDVIRKVGDTHEKFAFAPGTDLDNTPTNVAAARKVEAKNIQPKKLGAKP
jgi:hypothetical protein